MGVWDREYYREATRPAMFGSGSACAVLIAITSAIFVAQLLTLSRPDGVTA